MEENTLSIYQCGFRKKYSTQHALVKLHALNFDINALSMVFDYLQEGSKESILIPVLPHIWICFNGFRKDQF